MTHIPPMILMAYYSKTVVLPENSKHKYEFHYIIKGDDDWKRKLIEQKSKFTYYDDSDNLIWIKNYYYGKKSRILLSYNKIFIYESDELDMIHSLGSKSTLLNKALWELKAKKENDPNWLTRIDANFTNL